MALSEKQAWLVIAEAYATPRRKRSHEEYTLCHYGLCWAIFMLLEELGGMSIITEGVYAKMDDKIRRNLGGRLYFCPYFPANDLLRADFCYLMYYELGGTKV